MPRSVLFRLTPDELGHVYLVYDTFFQGKHLITAVGVGRIRRGLPEITATAQHTLDALLDYRQRDIGRVRMVEIATITAVPVRLRKALETANDKEAVFFIARNHGVYDAIYAALNVEHPRPAPLAY